MTGDPPAAYGCVARLRVVACCGVTGDPPAAYGCVGCDDCDRGGGVRSGPPTPGSLFTRLAGGGVDRGAARVSDDVKST